MTPQQITRLAEIQVAANAMADEITQIVLIETDRVKGSALEEAVEALEAAISFIAEALS